MGYTPSNGMIYDLPVMGGYWDGLFFGVCHIHHDVFIKVFMTRPGKRLHNYGKIHHTVNGKTHYFYGDFQ